MKRLSCIYTGMGGLTKTIEEKFNAVYGEPIKYNAILDSGIMRDIIENGGLNDELESRLEGLFDAASRVPSDAVVCTCSSIGAFADKYAAAHPDKKIVRIDYPMAKYAVDNYDNVALMATLATTVTPSSDLVVRLAKEADKNVTVTSAVADKAFGMLMGGDLAGASAEVVAVAKDLMAKSGAKILLLAQASMAAFQDALGEALPGVEILNSPQVFCDNFRDLVC